MGNLSGILPYVQITLSLLLIAAILLQQSGTTLGGAFGGGGDDGATHHTRRGFEKLLFRATIVLAILFALSAFAVLVSS